MNDQKTHNYDNDIITYAVDRNGGKGTLELREVTYDVYKVARELFDEHPDKAMRIIINACATEETKAEAFEYLDRNNLIAVRSLESGIANIIAPIPAEVKKKSMLAQ